MSIQRIQYADDKDVPSRIESQRWTADDHHHPMNLPPKGFKEVKEAEVAQSSFSQGFSWTEYRQVYVPGERHIVMLHIFWNDTGEGYALHFDYWGAKLRWFRVGCHHEWEQLPPLEAMTSRSRCKQCGYESVHDTSD